MTDVFSVSFFRFAILSFLQRIPLSNAVSKSKNQKSCLFGLFFYKMYRKIILYIFINIKSDKKSFLSAFAFFEKRA